MLVAIILAPHTFGKLYYLMLNIEIAALQG